MKVVTAILFPFIFSSFAPVSTGQAKEVLFYIKEKGLYIHFDSTSKRTKVPYKGQWDFYFSLKNDSTAIVQDIKKGISLPAKEYKVSLKLDSAITRRYIHGDTVKDEQIYYKTVY